MRNIRISEGEFYHVFNRGVGKKILFRDKSDYSRFLFLILYFQSPITFKNMSRVSKTTKEITFLHVSEKEVAEIVENRYVTLFAFCLMSNHFHILIRETIEGGIAKYMQRVLNSYTKYFNTKYEVSGHLFQGPYKAVHVEDNDQLLHLSAYIHKNCHEIAEWKNKYFEYPWSSLGDYVNRNRWGKLLETDIIFEQFKNQEEYRKFIKTSSAKEIADELVSI